MKMIIVAALLSGVSAMGSGPWEVYNLLQEKQRLEAPNPGRVSGSVTDEVRVGGAQPEAQALVAVAPKSVSKPASIPTVNIEQAFYIVRPGDTGLGRFGALGWSQVVELNKLTNPNRIFPGQKLRLPENVRARDDMMVFGGAVVKTRAAKPIKPEVACITLGVAPFNPEHSLARTLAGIDLLNTLSPQQKALAKEKVALANKTTTNELVDQQIFTEMLYQSKVSGQAKHVYGKPLCSADEGGQPEIMDSYDLGDGVFLAIPRRCGNPAVLMKPVLRREELVVVPQEPPPPPPAVVEKPVPAPEPAPMPKETPKEQPAPVCLLDPKMVVGQEHEPVQDGNDAHSSFLTAALYCTWRGTWLDDAGTHGVGFGLQGSWWSGRVNGGVGKFQGRLLAVGPGYEWISDKGWNVEGKVLFGRIHEYFNQGEYASSRTIDIVGPAASLNLGQRRARGEKFLPETRLYGMLGLPTSVEAEHSWEGKSIADTAELARFGFYLNLGLHQDVYDFEKFTLWGRAGYFNENPVSETANLRVGISDPQRICGIGVGLDFDLKQGGEAIGWGWWCDVVKGTQVVRSEYRLSQIIKETGATFLEDGTLFVPMTKPEQTD